MEHRSIEYMGRRELIERKEHIETLIRIAQAAINDHEETMLKIDRILETFEQPDTN